MSEYMKLLGAELGEKISAEKFIALVESQASEIEEKDADIAVCCNKVLDLNDQIAELNKANQHLKDVYDAEIAKLKAENTIPRLDVKIEKGSQDKRGCLYD